MKVDVALAAPAEERATYLPRLTVARIKYAAASATHVRPSDIDAHDRHQSVALGRHVAMWLCRELLGLSYPEIGRYFGGRDHTTVMAAVKRIGNLPETEHRSRAVLRVTMELLGVRLAEAPCDR